VEDQLIRLNARTCKKKLWTCEQLCRQQFELS